MERRTTLAAVAACAGSILLAGCGDDHSSQAGGASAPGDGARRIEVAADDFAFEPDAITVEAGEEVAVALTSADIVHDFVIDELGVHIHANGGDTVEGGLTAEEPGTYTFYCSVPGHRSAGMEGTLTVE